jgi:hypothetical protein
MNQDQYISERVDDQINWYSNKSSANKNWFKYLKLVEIVCAACIPFMAGFKGGSQEGNLVIAILGIVIALCASITSIFHHQENWVNYRATSEMLKHEKYLYLTKSEKYSCPESFEMFVQTVEGLISKETSSWASTIKSKSESKPTA